MTRTVAVAVSLVALSASGVALWNAKRGGAAASMPEGTPFTESAEPEAEPAAALRTSSAPALRARPPAFVPPPPGPGQAPITPEQAAMVVGEFAGQVLAKQAVLAAQMGLTAEQTEQFTRTMEGFNDAMVAAFQTHVLDVETKQGRASDADLDAYIAAIAKAKEKFRGQFEAIDPNVKRALESGDFNAMAMPDGRVAANALSLAERYPQYMLRLVQRL